MRAAPIGCLVRARCPARSGSLVVSLVLAALFCASVAAGSPESLHALPVGEPGLQVQTLSLDYRTSRGIQRQAIVLVPAGRPRAGERLPLIISPHGRGVTPRANCKLWGSLPALGRFAVVCPGGEGARLNLYSWGASAEIRDLASMPLVVERSLPWLAVDERRIYAVGGSMGGQEVLLLLARYPHLLAGAIAFDAVADLAWQYHELLRMRCDGVCRRRWHGMIGVALRREMRREVGGSPLRDSRAYVLRSPIHYARALARSGVPLELWWSVSDLTVRDQTRAQSGRLFHDILAANPRARVEAFVGDWIHSHEQNATARLPFALAQIGLLPRAYLRRPVRLVVRHFIPRRLFARLPGLRTTGIDVTGGHHLEFDFRLSQNTARTGLVVFTVRNAGRLRHRFKLCLPAGTGGDFCRGVETGWIDPGETSRLTVALTEPGLYEYECAIPGHADAGMNGELRVRW